MHSFFLTVSSDALLTCICLMPRARRCSPGSEQINKVELLVAESQSCRKFSVLGVDKKA